MQYVGAYEKLIYLTTSEGQRYKFKKDVSVENIKRKKRT